MIVGAQLRYKIENGFPVITERDLSGSMFSGALAEHVAFLNGARTQAELEKFGCKWWSKWVTKEKCAIFGLPEGDLGDGSYGAAWATFPTKEGKPFNQIKHVVQQMKERPYLRTHLISPWIPQYRFSTKVLPVKWSWHPVTARFIFSRFLTQKKSWCITSSGAPIFRSACRSTSSNTPVSA